MPIARIEVRKRWNREEKGRMIQALHESMVECLKIPEHDKLIRFFEYKPEDFVVPPGYTENYVLISETLHAVIAHDSKEKSLTIEAGVLKIADATDMTEGRSRIPFEAGKMNIHSVSTRAVDDVNIKKGENKPVCIEIKLNNPAGIFQIDEFLKNKLRYSPLKPFVEVIGKIEGEMEPSLFDSYSI